jgi:tetratricopeptide (TPR) repeat protein
LRPHAADPHLHGVESRPSRNEQRLLVFSCNAGAQRAFLGRLLRDRLAIIILTRGDSRRVEIADAIINIVHERPYDPPKLSIAPRLLAVIDSQGIESGLAFYGGPRRAAAKRYDFSEAQLNSLGYTLLERRRNADAIRVFELNAKQFPTSSNAFDSLGDALRQSGRQTEAAQAYSRAIELDPSNVNARTKLLKLKSHTWQLTAASVVLILAVSAAWFLLSRWRRITARRPSKILGNRRSSVRQFTHVSRKIRTKGLR